MAMKRAAPRVSTADAIERYFADRKAGEMISIRDALHDIRAIASICELTDEELTSLVAQHAIAHHCNVNFNGKDERVRSAA